MRVCLLTEGTYPYVRGGVSTWCHDLIAGLPDVEFVVYALIGNPAAHLEYEVPKNVSRVMTVPLWGHERLAEYNAPDLGATQGRSRSALRERFLPLFRQLLEQIVRGMQYASPSELTAVFSELYRYFGEHDYDWTMRRPEVWDTAMTFFQREPWHVRFMTSLEAVELVRSLYRYLIPLAIRVPRCDVVHTSAAGLCGIAATAAARVEGIPMLLTEHGIYLRERVLELARAGLPFSDRTVKKNLFSGVARAAYGSATAIAPVCAYNTGWERYYGAPDEKVRVIYNGVDETLFDDRDLSPEAPTVCATVRIDPLKDIPTLIASAATVRERIPNVRYKIWGPAPDAEYARRCRDLVAELSLQNVVEFMGPTRDPASAYAQSHVVALSSVSEGFPYTAIEAMMCGKPVVATDVGGVREAVDRFGAVVPPKQPERLGAAIADLLADPSHARALGKQARARALASFTRHAFLRSYRALYEELVAGVAIASTCRHSRGRDRQELGG